MQEQPDPGYEPKPSRGLSALVLTLVLATTSFACGGKQSPEDGGPEIVEETPSCISDRWAEPPEQVGQTPPSEFPSPDSLDPFRRSGSTPGKGDERDASESPGANDGSESEGTGENE